MSEDKNLPAVIGESWGAEDISNSDIQIPTLMLQHDISKLVKAEQAKAGSIVSSMMNELKAARGEYVEIIAFKSYREYLVNEVNAKGQQVKFLGRFPVTQENEGWSRDAIVDGKAVERIKSLNFFVVLPKHLHSLPHVVAFKKSGYRTGKALATHFKTCQMTKTAPAATVFKLGAVENTWDGNTFWVFDLQPSRPATPEEIELAKQWYLTLREAQVVVHDDNTTSEDAPSF